MFDNLPVPRPPFNPTDPSHSDPDYAAGQAQVAAEAQPLKFNEYRLPDGRIVSVRRGKGRDVRDAARLATSGSDNELGLALACLASSIDGKGVIYEDFLEWDLDDCYAIGGIYQELRGKKN